MLHLGGSHHLFFCFCLIDLFSVPFLSAGNQYSNALLRTSLNATVPFSPFFSCPWIESKYPVEKPDDRLVVFAREVLNPVGDVDAKRCPG